MNDKNKLIEELNSVVGEKEELGVLEKFFSQTSKQIKDLRLKVDVLTDKTGKLENVKEVIVKNQPQFPNKLDVDVKNFPPQKDFPKEIKVSNLPEYPQFPEEIGLKEPDWIERLDQREILKIVADLIKQGQGRVQRVQVENTTPGEAVAVRFTDKDAKRFIDSLSTVIAGGGGESWNDYSGGKYGKNVFVYDDAGNQITSFGGSSSGADESLFRVNQLDKNTTNILYIGMSKSDGTWLIKKYDKTTPLAPVLSYATIANNPLVATYALAWAAIGTLTYQRYDQAF